MLADEVKDWVIVASGMLLLGKTVDYEPGDRTMRLSPVYQLQAQATQTGPNRIDILHICGPVGMLPSFDSIYVSLDMPIKRVSDLSVADQRKILRAIQLGEQTVQKMRLGDAGIVPPSS